MFKYSHLLKNIFFQLLIVLLLFTTLIFVFENKNTMTLTMHSNSKHPLEVVLYYTKKGYTFNDHKASYGKKISANKYFFILPDLKDIQYARLDPSIYTQGIFIHKDILITVSKWFITSTYFSDITKSKPGNQINNYIIKQDGIEFRTTGNDPQLHLNLTRSLQHTFWNFHINTFFQAIFIYLLLLFFYKLYNTKEPNVFLPKKWLMHIMASKLHSLFIIGFLIILGSHFLDYYPFIFIFTGIILIDWRKIHYKKIFLLILFIGSIYTTWFFIDKSHINYYIIIGQGIMLIIAYMLGLSIHINALKKNIYYKKIIFYLFFGFFLAYLTSLIYSYFYIPQDNPMTEGMRVCFPNEYKRLNANQGNLVSTILAYYLTFTSILIPFILVYSKKLSTSKFSYFELTILFIFSIFSFYLVFLMERRIVFVLLILTFLYLGTFSIFKNKNSYYFFNIVSILSIIIIVLFAGYYFSNTMLAQKITNIIHDNRFQFWLPGIKVMLQHPFGGGSQISVAEGITYAHNTWIDIGKNFGIIPFIASIVFFIIHTYYLFRLIKNPTIDNFTKNLFLIFFYCFIAIMMIEPVFNSDKTFFFYILFFLGLLKNYEGSLSSPSNVK